ncbi:hypothetical protein CY34DRAFT_814294 [Suillus luteus UH-Slu-Lm8-n1]|uniref:Uncharacterized protein n=1 Tax=Suillus luteus UH-Slu-Lm8-n1 TaxID=930992 RepID=A0A0D0A2P3_9AGAM|nr:hypothetical protein CY34DRAFT_814294 [Suillus luteus UH-Slu-Lm8-n1]
MSIELETLDFSRLSLIIFRYVFNDGFLVGIAAATPKRNMEIELSNVPQPTGRCVWYLCIFQNSKGRGRHFDYVAKTHHIPLSLTLAGKRLSF